MKKFAFALIALLALTISVAMADTLVLPEDVTTIGAEAFYGTDAETIILPEGVTSIGDRAFGGSATLRTVYVPDGLMGREQAALTGSPNARFVSRSQDWSAEYDYTVGDAGVTITAYKGTAAEVVIPAAIEGKTVTTIGNSAFKSNATLTKVVIPEGVTELQTDAFHSCYLLTDVTFPQSLRTIGYNTFYCCGNQAEAAFYWRLPDNLTEIAGVQNGSNYSFRECNAVKVVTPDSATARLLSTANGAERGWFTYPDEEDFRYIFYQSEENGAYDTLHLMKYVGTGTQVAIPDHGTASTPVGVIQNGAFKSNATLTKVVIPEGVTELQTDAFHSCHLLTDVTFPQSLRTIGYNTFYCCGSQAEEAFFWRLPDNLTEIAGVQNGSNYSFRECNAVKVVTPDSATARLLSTANGDERGWFTYPDEENFRYIFYQSEENGAYDTLHLMKYVGTGTQVAIPDHGTASTPVGVIQNGAFKSNATLTKVVIPEGVTELQTDAFHSCHLLTDVTFPQSLRAIGYNTFYCCGSQAEEAFFWRLPDNLTEIAGVQNGSNYSFRECSAVKVVTPDSATARLLSTANGDERGWFTYPDEEDFRYIFYQSEENGAYDTLHLMKYVGTGTEVEIPDHGTASTRIGVIHDSAFKGNATLTKVVIPEGVTDIQVDAFHSCYLLTDVTFPQSLRILGKHAFMYSGENAADNFYYILPNTIAEMGNAPFESSKARLCCDRYINSDYSDYTSTYLLLGDKWWGWAEGPFRMKDCYVTYTHPEEQVTEQVLRIELGGYVPEEGTDWMQPVTIPRSVYRIGDDCFKNLTELSCLIMPEYDLDEGDVISRSVQEIGANAFAGCSSLTSITFPSLALSHIAVGAFSGCGNNAPFDSYTFTFGLPETDSFRAGVRQEQDWYYVADCNARFDINWIEVAPILN